MPSFTTLSTRKPAAMRRHVLPPWLREKVASPPPAGGGLHPWFFSTARQLHAHYSADEIVKILQDATTDCGRLVPLREIQHAVRNSYPVQWQPKGGVLRAPSLGGVVLSSAPAPQRKITVDTVARACRIAEVRHEVETLNDLWAQCAVTWEHWGVDDWLDYLFPGAEWLCLAEAEQHTARTRPPSKWYFGEAEKRSFIVPSPMTGPSGLNQDGKPSHRCLDNTGPRRWLVIEFDSGTIDEQASLHWYLRAAARAVGWPRLRLCVHSGGKSLHGWYGPCADEASAMALMDFALILGADRATRERCQLVRLPCGVRNGKRQEVFFFEPAP